MKLLEKWQGDVSNNEMCDICFFAKNSFAMFLYIYNILCKQGLPTCEGVLICDLDLIESIQVNTFNRLQNIKIY